MINQLLKAVWLWLPKRVRTSLRQGGVARIVPFIRFVVDYRRRHDVRNFAGNLVDLRERGGPATLGEGTGWSDQIDAILDALVLPNGVKKTTHARRQHGRLVKFLSAQGWRIDKPAIRVLDLPSSSGQASLDCLALLRQHYSIATYALADLCFDLYYDRERGCVFDDMGNLLQVRLQSQFFSLYQAHSRGGLYSPLTRFFLLPVTVMSRHLRRKFAFHRSRNLVPVSLVHPEVEKLRQQGIFTLRRCNVFELGIREEFDLVLSFNLLRRDYFSAKLIRRGMQNLADALVEGGYLLTNRAVLQKRHNRLVVLDGEGQW